MRVVSSTLLYGRGSSVLRTVTRSPTRIVAPSVLSAAAFIPKLGEYYNKVRFTSYKWAYRRPLIYPPIFSLLIRAENTEFNQCFIREIFILRPSLHINIRKLTSIPNQSHHLKQGWYITSATASTTKIYHPHRSWFPPNDPHQRL